MAVGLEGGCRVTDLREGEPERQGSLQVWTHFGRRSGASAISLRVLDLAAGLSPPLGNAGCDEVLYVLEGEGSVRLDGRTHTVAPGTGIYLAPGVGATFENTGPGALVVVSSRCPDPEGAGVEPVPAPAPTLIAAPVVRLWERTAEITGDRWYRVLVDQSVGCSRVTQFVGSIPPGRAPDHYHAYEEVLCILAGAGRMWAGPTSTPIGPGSCVFLPRGQVHCVENTGPGELRLLGVFYPSGSPAVRYDPD